jgi:hypothetical protein
MDYSKFIKGVILRDIILDKNEVEGRFRLNNRIISEFNKIPFGDFLVKYTKYERENECSLGNDLSHDEKMTVIYCLYQNNYYTGFDDVIGLYLSEKIDLILQRTIEEIDIYY